MKNLIIYLLSLSLFFTCTQPKQVKFIGWNDAIKLMYIDGDGQAQGTAARVNDLELTGGSGGLVILPYDNDHNYVGTERGKIRNNNKNIVTSYAIYPNQGYYIDVRKGSDINQAGWDASGISMDGDGVKFNFNPILAHNLNLSVGDEIAIIDIYTYTDRNEVMLVAQSSLRL